MKIFFSAGELSGDIHAGELIRELRKIEPELLISAIGGDNMAKAGAELIYHIRETSFMGITEVIKHLPSIRKILKNTIDFVDREKPDLIVTVDYPGFNLRLARAAWKRKIPVVYYISPTVWAWHQSRVKKIKKYTKEMLCILPFEEDWYKNFNVNATYVGNPLMDKYGDIKIENNRKKSHLIGLFPGSRKQEVEKHLPIMIESIILLRKEFPEYQAAVAEAPGIDFGNYKKQFPCDWLKWETDQNSELMVKSDFLIMSSGTASLEAAIHNTPMVVIYSISAFSFWLIKKLVSISYISLTNLIAGEGGIKELIQDDLTPENIAAEASRILTNQEEEKKMRLFLKNVTEKIGRSGASKRAAQIIVKWVKH